MIFFVTFLLWSGLPLPFPLPLAFLIQRVSCATVVSSRLPSLCESTQVCPIFVSGHLSSFGVVGQPCPVFVFGLYLCFGEFSQPCSMLVSFFFSLYEFSQIYPMCWSNSPVLMCSVKFVLRFWPAFCPVWMSAVSFVICVCLAVCQDGWVQFILSYAVSTRLFNLDEVSHYV